MFQYTNKINLGREFGLTISISDYTWSPGVEIHLEALGEEMTVRRGDAENIYVSYELVGFDGQIMGQSPTVEVPIFHRTSYGQDGEYACLKAVYDAFADHGVFLTRTALGSELRFALGKCLTRSNFLFDDMLMLGDRIAIPHMSGSLRVDSHGNNSYLTIFRIFEKARRAKLYLVNKAYRGVFHLFTNEEGDQPSDDHYILSHLGNLSDPDPNHTHVTFEKLKRFAEYFGVDHAFDIVSDDHYQCEFF